MAQDGSNKKVANSLVAMSCAAVLTVYAAGYARTQSAADRLATQIAERRAEVPGPLRTDVGEVWPAAPSAPAASALPVPTENAVTAPSLVGSPQEHVPPQVPAKISGPGSAAEPLPAETSEPTLPAAPEAVPAAAPVVAINQTVSPTAPALEHKAEVSAVAPPAALPAAPAPAAAWKDGTYTGWGYSRHGNIEAEVVIQGGRIASAIISQCRTRYSCSVIDKLIPQVAQRQSPDVDYVSGATQSANAFYGAVVEALNKAK
jgi:uncharacterized protein with FMN-binding domain